MDREEIIPERREFSYFPLFRGDWIGRENAIAPDILEALDHPDYIQADYRRGSQGMPVNLYVAYYESRVSSIPVSAQRQSTAS